LKTSWILLVCLLFLACNKPERKDFFYRAISNNKKDTAYLKITEFGNLFIGKYLVNYSDKSFDLGNISGEISGDTLKGRNKYTSRRKSIYIKPIVFLKEADKLKLGTGMVSIYSQIPFYANGTIEFPDSLFLFYPIDKSKIKF